ncbi:MAG: hypothetical protein P1S60_08245 [Anaerolineae bacterium]|nr:hypothetical protein [Anaerolineae bacterium]
MVIELLSILIFTFALTLFILGAITWLMERDRRRLLSFLMMGAGLLIAIGYAFLGSRFSITTFGRLIITIDLPRLMTTAIVYTIGVLVGVSLAGGLFLWITGRLLRPSNFESKLIYFICAVLAIALFVSMLAVRISQ